VVNLRRAAAKPAAVVLMLEFRDVIAERDAPPRAERA